MTTDDAIETLMRDRKANKVWDVITRIGLIFGVAAAGLVYSLDTRVTRIEASRFTSADGHKLEASLRAELPPQWLREDLKELKSMMLDITTRLRKLETKR